MKSLPQNNLVLLGLTSGALALGGICYYYKTRKNWQKVATVSKLYIHPIKGCRGIELERAFCTPVGFHNDIQGYDRNFLMVLPNGQQIHGGMHPKIVLIEISLGEKCLELSAPGMSNIIVRQPNDSADEILCRVWGQEISGLDCGQEIADWLSKYIGTDARLVFHPPHFKTRPPCVNYKFANEQKNNGMLAFQDSSAHNILSEESLKDLNSRIETSVTARNFRPNIVIKGNVPYDEHNWRHIRINGVEFKFAKHCDRCIRISIDPETGIKHPEMEPLKTLKTYRLSEPKDRIHYKESPLFGVNLGTTQRGFVNVGDEVYAC